MFGFETLKEEVLSLRTGRLDYICGREVLSYKQKGWRAVFWVDGVRHVVSGYPNRFETLEEARNLLLGQPQETASEPAKPTFNKIPPRRDVQLLDLEPSIKPTFDKLPRREREFLLDLYWNKQPNNNAVTFMRLSLCGYVDHKDTGGTGKYELTPEGRKVTAAGIRSQLDKQDAQTLELTIGQTVYLKVDYNNHHVGQPLEVLGDSNVNDDWKLSPHPTHIFVRTPGALGYFPVDVAEHISTTPLHGEQPYSETFHLQQIIDERNATLDILRREYRRARMNWEHVLTEDMPKLMASEIILQRRNREVEQAYSDSLKAKCDVQEQTLREIKRQAEDAIEMIMAFGHGGTVQLEKIIAQVDAITQEQAHVE